MRLARVVQCQPRHESTVSPIHTKLGWKLSHGKAFAVSEAKQPVHLSFLGLLIARLWRGALWADSVKVTIPSNSSQSTDSRRAGFPSTLLTETSSGSSSLNGTSSTARAGVGFPPSSGAAPKLDGRRLWKCYAFELDAPPFSMLY